MAADRIIKHLPLKTLSLFGTYITDEGLRDLAEIPTLTLLTLDYTAVTDAGIAHLARSPNLGSLRVTHTKISTNVVEALLEFRKVLRVTVDREIAEDERIARRCARPDLTIDFDPPRWTDWPLPF